MLLILHNARFRLVWLNAITNDMALMVFFTVNGWLALSVTDSAFWTGVTAGMGGIGLMTTSLLAGVLVDRLDRRMLIVASQIAQAVLFAVVAALIFTDNIGLWQILLASFLDGVIVAVKVPSRMALTLDVAGRENLLKANAANFAAMTSMGIVIPPLAGLIVAAFDIAWAYVFMAVILVISAAIITTLRGVERPAKGASATPLQDFKAGFRYVFTTPRVRLLILMGLSSEAFGWAHETMLPVMARDVLHTGPAGLGYIISAGSVGALITTLVLSSLGDVKNRGRLFVAGYVGFGLFLMLFAASSWLPLSLLFIALAYACVALYETLLSTLLQTAVPDAMRGRIISFQIFTWGVTGASGFHTGAIAALLGAPVAIALGGGVLVINGLRLFKRLATRYSEPTPELAPGD